MDGSTLWEGVLYHEEQYGPLCPVLHVMEGSWEEFVRQLEVALPALSEVE
ncbi:MAG: hypothetical protein RRA32_09990 [bacterium]|nr:hypothetical protein [bacterium]